MAKYSNEVMEAVRQNVGLDEDDTSSDALIEGLSRGKVFERYLNWEGIIGYDQQILRVIEDIYKIKLSREL